MSEPAPKGRGNMPVKAHRIGPQIQPRDRLCNNCLHWEIVDPEKDAGECLADVPDTTPQWAKFVILQGRGDARIIIGTAGIGCGSWEWDKGRSETGNERGDHE